MPATARRRKWALCAIAGLTLVGGCARLPGPGVTTLKISTSSELRQYLLTRKADVDQFRFRGPFEVTTLNNHELRLSDTERFEADLYLSAPPEKAPFVILLHGHDSTKEDHAYQGYHLATWGLHSVAVNLPNNGPWLRNGRTLARIAAAIRRRPELIDRRVDADRIVLAGHSFGSAAVTIALAEGAPVAGGILLDAAATGRDMPKFLRKIGRPVMLLGADEYVSPVRFRDLFYEYIRANVAEVSIADATHEDAQFPLEPAPYEPGSESVPTEELQITFVSALTASALSLAYTGTLDYAWASFSEAIKSGKLLDAKRKPAARVNR